MFGFLILPISFLCYRPSKVQPAARRVCVVMVVSVSAIVVVDVGLRLVCKRLY